MYITAYNMFIMYAQLHIILYKYQCPLYQCYDYIHMSYSSLLAGMAVHTGNDTVNTLVLMTWCLYSHKYSSTISAMVIHTYVPLVSLQLRWCCILGVLLVTSYAGSITYVYIRQTGLMIGWTPSSIAKCQHYVMVHRTLYQLVCNNTSQ